MPSLACPDDVATTGREQLGWPLVLGTVAVAILVRLWNIGSAPFIQDEPILLGAAREQLSSGRWLTASPLHGTQGIRYGPTVVWFYSVLQWTLGARPLVAIVAMCVLLSVTQVLLIRGATLVFGGRTVTFLLLAGLLLSSPYLYFWSRLAWDQTVLICVAATVCILCAPVTIRQRHAAAVGVLVGLAVSSHLMVVPFVLALVGVIAWELRATPGRAVKLLGVLIAPAVVVNIPYIWFLATHAERVATPAPDLASVAANLAETPAVSTSFGIEYFFDGNWQGFRHWMGAAAPLLHLRPAIVASIATLAVIGLVSALHGDDVRQRRIARLAGATWIAAAIIFAVQGVGQQPHYQFAVWWVIPVGLASALQAASARARFALAAVVAVVTSAMVLQVAFLGAWRGYIDTRSGTRGVHHGASLATQVDAVRAICSLADTTIAVQNETSVFAVSLTYLVGVTGECAGKHVDICEPTACVDTASEARSVRLVYRDDEGATLRVKR